MRRKPIQLLAFIFSFVALLLYIQYGNDGRLEPQQDEDTEKSVSVSNGETRNIILERIQDNNTSLIESHKEDRRDPEKFVNKIKAIEDPEYGKKILKSNLIKQYLEAPRRDDPLYQDVLNTLLENGYGIENWSSTCGLILSWQMPIYLTEQDLKLQGYTGSDLDTKLNEILDGKKDFRQMLIDNSFSTTGIPEPDLIEKLLDIPLRTTRNEVPFGYAGTTTNDGDRIFTDEDWMTETHKKYKEKSELRASLNNNSTGQP